MSETLTGAATPPTEQSQARRAELGIVAAYIHELSERHGGARDDGHAGPELPAEDGD